MIKDHQIIKQEDKNENAWDVEKKGKEMATDKFYIGNNRVLFFVNFV